MKKIEHNFKVTHIFADGKVLSDEEFMAKPFVVSAELNKEVFDEIKIILFPEHIKQQKQIEQLKKTQQLREKLLMELANIGGD